MWAGRQSNQVATRRDSGEYPGCSELVCYLSCGKHTCTPLRTKALLVTSVKCQLLQNHCPNGNGKSVIKEIMGQHNRMKTRAQVTGAALKSTHIWCFYLRTLKSCLPVMFVKSLQQVSQKWNKNDGSARLCSWVSLELRALVYIP